MKVSTKSSPQHGRGVFADAPIRAGETILIFSGPLLHVSAIRPDDYHLQIAEDYYLGASGKEDDYVNHSCAPNGGFREGLELVALRDIAVGEEVTWDYSTAIDEAEFTGFPCNCGAAQCRRVVQSFRFLGASDQARLRPWLMPYLRAKYFAAPA